jgi:poly-gamma-glutamate synthesis protein (capsule biosynthesis protein)
MANGLQAAARAVGFSGERFDLNRFRVARLPIHVGRSFRLQIRARLDDIDRAANLAAVGEAARQAQVVIVSVHAHERGPWLRRFAHDAIDAGAHVFFAHGPHAIHGIELYRGRPILYCLGGFVFQTHHIERLPPEYQERFGTVYGATPEEVADRPARLAARREIWEGVAAAISIEAGRVTGIELLPLDLGFGEPAATRGIPRWAEPARGRAIVERVARLSRGYGTRVRYDAGRHVGVVDGIAVGAEDERGPGPAGPD